MFTYTRSEPQLWTVGSLGPDGKWEPESDHPQIRIDEVAIAIDLHFPSTWGRVVHSIDLAVPDFAPTQVTEAVDGV